MVRLAVGVGKAAILNRAARRSFRRSAAEAKTAQLGIGPRARDSYGRRIVVAVASRRQGRPRRA